MKAARVSDNMAADKPAPDNSPGVFQRQLSVIASQIDLAVDRVLHEKYDLNNSEWQVLAALLSGSATFYEVVARCAIDKARVSRAQKRLVDRNYLMSEPHAVDGRKIVLSLTPAGKRLLTGLVREIEFIENCVLGELLPEEQDTLRIAVGKLAQQFIGAQLGKSDYEKRPKAGI